MLVDLQIFLNKQNHLKGTHYGRVVDNKDPEMQGYIKVEIPGLLEGDADSLPWVAPKLPVFLGGSAGAQLFCVPNVGAEVAVELDDIYTPFYVGWTPSAHTLNEEMQANYPNTYGFIDETGNAWVVNKEEETLEIRHSSGSYIKMEKDGLFTLVTTANAEINVEGDCTINVTGNANAVVDGNVQVDAGANATVTAGANATVEAGAQANVTGSIVNVEADGVCMVSGAMVQIQ